MRKLPIILLLLCTLTPAYAENKQPGKAGVFFCRVGKWIEGVLLNGLDTNYVTLPEYSWRIAATAGTVGLHSTYEAKSTPYLGDVSLFATSTPSVDLGFNAGYRAIGIGYSWDLMHKNGKNINLSIGSKMFGLEFVKTQSANFNSLLYFPSASKEHVQMDPTDVWITHTNLSVWYALNWAHYSHNAAIKQAFLQRKTAGSLLLSAAYNATNISFHDEDQLLPDLLYDVNKLITHQASVGLGYGINYTPNQGKVLLHLSATAKLVFYSINQIFYASKNPTEKSYAEPCYNISPSRPVHVSGSMRAAVSWEVNQYVHMSAWGQADNVRFEAGSEDTLAKFSNWNWHAHLNVGVRFGVGKSRIRKIIETADRLDPSIDTPPAAVRKSRLPQWLTDYFFSPRM